MDEMDFTYVNEHADYHDHDGNNNADHDNDNDSYGHNNGVL